MEMHKEQKDMIPGQLSLGSQGPRERFNFFHKAFDSLDLEHVSQKPRKPFDPENPFAKICIVSLRSLFLTRL